MDGNCGGLEGDRNRLMAVVAEYVVRFTQARIEIESCTLSIENGSAESARTEASDSEVISTKRFMSTTKIICIRTC